MALIKRVNSLITFKRKTNTDRIPTGLIGNNAPTNPMLQPYSVSPDKYQWSIRSEADLTYYLPILSGTGGGIAYVVNSFTVSHAISIPDNIVLRGLGRGATITVDASIGASITLGDNCVLEHLSFGITSNGNIINVAGDNCILDKCFFTILAASSETALYVTGNHNRILASTFTDTSGTGIAINYNAGVDNTDSNCIFV